MNKTYSNPCTRCGRERIQSKTWKEKITNFAGTSTVTHTESICPDPDCQKVVDAQLAAQKERSDAIKLDKENRIKLKKAKN